MNEHGHRSQHKAYLVADIDFNGPLPVVRGFDILSRKPYHEQGRGPNRAWATIMVRAAGSFASARKEVLDDLLAHAHNHVYASILRLLDEAPDEATHARKYRLSQALDMYVANMPVPDHPFFQS